jgi:hypothetical protein
MQELTLICLDHYCNKNILLRKEKVGESHDPVLSLDLFQLHKNSNGASAQFIQEGESRKSVIKEI